ncbi:MAG: efflux RND transporter periplasmic adaptor subunit [Gammaproteobacteria bacterium]|nr:efflux RND transporter periplasmic adaptor subunit [Gammaproteobacteria bacterium]
MKPMRLLRLSQMCLAAMTLASPSLWAQAPAIIKVEQKSYPNWFALEAKMEAVNQATISAQTSGRVQSIEVDVNDYVEKGDIIIQLRNKQQRATVAQAQAGLSQAQAANTDAQSQLKRATPLFEQGSLSKGQYDTIKATSKATAAQVKAAQALVEQAKEQLAYTQIRAPYAGIVKARLVEVGETVNPGTPLMTGLSLNKLRAVADMPQRFAPLVNQNSDVKVTHGDKTFAAQKVTVFPYADPNSHSFKIRVDVNTENAGLFPGMWVKMMLPMGDTQAMRIPVSSVIRQGEVSQVYVQQGDQFQLRQVRLGQTHHQDDASSVDVLAGLNDGDLVAQDAYAVMAAKEI